MNATNLEGVQDNPGSFSPAMWVLAFQSLDKSDWLFTTEERRERQPVEFADCLQEDF